MSAGEQERAEDRELKRLAQARFGRQASRYRSSRTHAGGEELARMIELARPTGGERLLDVATGAGHTALAFAPHVREVIALDLAPAMLREAARHLQARETVHVRLLAGDAEAMPLAAPTTSHARNGSWPRWLGSSVPAGAWWCSTTWPPRMT